MNMIKNPLSPKVIRGISLAGLIAISFFGLRGYPWSVQTGGIPKDINPNVWLGLIQVSLKLIACWLLTWWIRAFPKPFLTSSKPVSYGVSIWLGLGGAAFMMVMEYRYWTQPLLDKALATLMPEFQEGILLMFVGSMVAAAWGIAWLNHAGWSPLKSTLVTGGVMFLTAAAAFHRVPFREWWSWSPFFIPLGMTLGFEMANLWPRHLTPKAEAPSS